MLGWTQRHSLGEQHVPEKVINTTLEVEETVAEEGREAVFPGIRRDRAHGNLIEASRRERRRRKREERRARGRSR